MAADRIWMYRQPRVWETSLSGVNGFLAQAEADMRNRGVPTMHCSCVDYLNQKKFGQLGFKQFFPLGFKEFLPGISIHFGFFPQGFFKASKQ